MKPPPLPPPLSTPLKARDQYESLAWLLALFLFVNARSWKQPANNDDAARELIRSFGEGL